MVFKPSQTERQREGQTDKQRERESQSGNACLTETKTVPKATLCETSWNNLSKAVQNSEYASYSILPSKLIYFGYTTG